MNTRRGCGTKTWPGVLVDAEPPFSWPLRAVDWLLHNPNGQGIVLGMSTENTEMLQEYVHNILLSCNAKLHKVTRYNISLNGSTGRLLFPNNWAGGLCGQSPGHVFVDNFSKNRPWHGAEHTLYEGSYYRL